MTPSPFDPPPARRRRAALAAATALVVVGLAVEPALPQSSAGASSESDLETNPRKHRRRQQRPVEMGTSGGNVNDITDRFCCAGTLGGVVRKGGRLFVLSNNHVLALSNLGEAGDAVSQPGLIDNRCAAPNRNVIAELSGFKKIKFGRGKNQVDAAIAAIVDGAVDESGAMIGIGVPGTVAVKPEAGMRVRKAGRTTGVTEGVVDSVNATVSVQYGEECSDDAAVLTARFVKQFIVVSESSQSFSKGGDSGAVIVENTPSCPNQVGLLFAGSGQFTVANKMTSVLKQVKRMQPKGPAELVGCPERAAAAKRATRDAPDERELRRAERVQARAEAALFGLRGVQGLGLGRSPSDPGAPLFKVYVDAARPELISRIPRALEGIPVEIVESGPIFAHGCPPPAASGAARRRATG